MSVKNAGTTLKLVVAGGVVLGAYWAGLSHQGPRAELADDAEATVEPGYAGFSPFEIDLGRHPWYAEVPLAALSQAGPRGGVSRGRNNTGARNALTSALGGA